jgi:hypothetical protein
LPVGVLGPWDRDDNDATPARRALARLAQRGHRFDEEQWRFACPRRAEVRSQRASRSVPPWPELLRVGGKRYCFEAGRVYGELAGPAVRALAVEWSPPIAAASSRHRHHRSVGVAPMLRALASAHLDAAPAGSTLANAAHRDHRKHEHCYSGGDEDKQQDGAHNQLLGSGVPHARSGTVWGRALQGILLIRS